MRAVVSATLDGAWFFRLACGHDAERDPRDLRPDAARRAPEMIACEKCGASGGTP